MYDALFSPASVLVEQIARQVFEVLPEAGPTLVIIDKQGHLWPSDSEGFAKLGISESFLKQLRARVDDGGEPVVTQLDQGSVIASQLATDKTDCGYIVMVLPQYGPEATLANIALVEVILNQMSLVARLVEKNSSLYELQQKHFGCTAAGIHTN